MGRKSWSLVLGLGVVLVGIVWLCVGATPALAQNAPCTPITSVPIVISAPGLYCFSQNLSTSTSGRAIDVQASNVTVDFRGFALECLNPNSGVVGLYSNAQRMITVRGGSVIGCARGVQLWDDANVARSHVLEELVVDGSSQVAITVRGEGTIVRNNFVNGSGSIGVYALGSGSLVQGNTVSNTAGVAIFFDYASGLAVENRIINASVGVQYAGATGKLRGNLTFGVATPFSGGTDAGTNN